MDEEQFEMMEPLRRALESAMAAAKQQGHHMSETIDSFVAAHATCELCGATVRVGYSVSNPRSDPIVLDGTTTSERCAGRGRRTARPR
jgi:hypothetical protein